MKQRLVRYVLYLYCVPDRFGKDLYSPGTASIISPTANLIWSHCQETLNSLSGFETRFRVKEARKGFLLLQWLWNDGRLQRRIFNGMGKLYVSLQLYCWAILWGYLWCHISYHGNAQGAQKRPLNFSLCKLSEKLIRWPSIFISLLESSLNSLTFQTIWKKFIK